MPIFLGIVKVGELRVLIHHGCSSAWSGWPTNYDHVCPFPCLATKSLYPCLMPAGLGSHFQVAACFPSWAETDQHLFKFVFNCYEQSSVQNLHRWICPRLGMADILHIKGRYLLQSPLRTHHYSIQNSTESRRFCIVSKIRRINVKQGWGVLNRLFPLTFRKW